MNIEPFVASTMLYHGFFIGRSGNPLDPPPPPPPDGPRTNPNFIDFILFSEIFVKS